MYIIKGMYFHTMRVKMFDDVFIILVLLTSQSSPNDLPSLVTFLFLLLLVLLNGWHLNHVFPLASTCTCYIPHPEKSSSIDDRVSTTCLSHHFLPFFLRSAEEGPEYITSHCVNELADGGPAGDGCHGLGQRARRTRCRCRRHRWWWDCDSSVAACSWVEFQSCIDWAPGISPSLPPSLRHGAFGRGGWLVAEKLPSFTSTMMAIVVVVLALDGDGLEWIDSWMAGHWYIPEMEGGEESAAAGQYSRNVVQPARNQLLCHLQVKTEC